jgi:hypothetical protein
MDRRGQKTGAGCDDYEPAGERDAQRLAARRGRSSAKHRTELGVDAGAPIADQEIVAAPASIALDQRGRAHPRGGQRQPAPPTSTSSASTGYGWPVCGAAGPMFGDAIGLDKVPGRRSTGFEGQMSTDFAPSKLLDTTVAEGKRLQDLE